MHGIEISFQVTCVITCSDFSLEHMELIVTVKELDYCTLYLYY
jgi:hypothetical protein